MTANLFEPPKSTIHEVAQRKRVLQVARDVSILLMLTFFGGLIIGIAVGKGAPGNPQALAAVAISNLVFSVIGFCISGALARVNRFSHLVIVAVVFWLCSSVNMFIASISVLQWMSSILFIFITMGVGGALSFLFVSLPKEEVLDAA